MSRMKHQHNGLWQSVGRKRYQHVSGVEIVYRHNFWLWEIVGGKYDGHRYERLWAAQHAATS